MMKKLLSSLGLGVLTAGLGVLPAAATASTVVVNPANMHGWVFVDDQTNSTATATGKMVNGPGSPPAGTGSAQISVSGLSQGQIISNLAYAGTPLSSITNLDYWSYQSGPTLALAFQFDVRYHPSDTGYQGRLVFEPYQQSTNPVGSGWQHWTNLTSGVWWASKTSAAGSSGLCPQSNPCNWSQILSNWPHASILYNVLFKAGSGWNAFSGNVDAFTIGINGNNTTYDFEAAPASKTDCEHDAWKKFTDPAFKNQGQCVEYVEHHQKNHDDGNRHDQDKDHHNNDGEHSHRDSGN